MLGRYALGTGDNGYTTEVRRFDSAPEASDVDYATDFYGQVTPHDLLDDDEDASAIKASMGHDPRYQLTLGSHAGTVLFIADLYQTLAFPVRDAERLGRVVEEEHGLALDTSRIGALFQADSILDRATAHANVMTLLTLHGKQEQNKSSGSLCGALANTASSGLVFQYSADDASTVLKILYKHSSVLRDQEIADVIVALSRLLNAKSFSIVDGILGSADIRSLSVEMLITLLRTTAAAQDKLRNWDSLLQKGVQKLRSQGREPSKVLRGLLPA
jgi:hypothetical protein